MATDEKTIIPLRCLLGFASRTVINFVPGKQWLRVPSILPTEVDREKWKEKRRARRGDEGGEGTKKKRADTPIRLR